MSTMSSRQSNKLYRCIATWLLVCLWQPQRSGADENLIGDRVWVGMNLGNLKIYPFAGAPYAHDAADIMQLVKEAIDGISSSGGNAVRIWLHIDGSRNPSWSSSSSDNPGVVTGIDQEVVEDLKRTLEICYRGNVKVLLSLWSHDILAVRKNNPPGNTNRAIHMITDDDATQAYIDKALLPLVRQLRDQWIDFSRGLHYADMLIGYEVFNEPEGVSWDARLYHDYMYGATWGLYEMENPDVYDADAARSLDYKSLGFLKNRTFVFNKPGDYNTAVFQGMIPLGGRPTPGTPYPTCPPPRYRPPGTSRYNYKTADIPPGFWFNRHMYEDVFKPFNSEYDYLIGLVQRFINRLAGAIHREHPSAKVTVGMHSIPYMTDVQYLKGSINNFEPNPRDYYAPWALQGAFRDDNGNILPIFDPLGYLDFYAPHAYPDWSSNEDNAKFSPFYHNKATWGVYKPVILGEFWDAKAADTKLSFYDLQAAIQGGYAGFLGWSYYTAKEQPGGFRTAPRTIVEHEMRQPILQMISQLQRY